MMASPIFANRGAVPAVDVELGSPPSSLTAHEREALMEAGGSVFRIGTVSEAGGSGLGDALASPTNQLAVAYASIADLQAQLGAARAELALRAELHDAVLKNAVLEAKHEAQAKLGALRVERQSIRDYIAQLEATWEQWRGSEAQPPANRDVPGTSPAEEAMRGP